MFIYEYFGHIIALHRFSGQSSQGGIMKRAIVAILALGPRRSLRLRPIDVDQGHEGPRRRRPEGGPAHRHRPSPRLGQLRRDHPRPSPTSTASRSTSSTPTAPPARRSRRSRPTRTTRAPRLPTSSTSASPSAPRPRPTASSPPTRSRPGAPSPTASRTRTATGTATTTAPSPSR